MRQHLRAGTLNGVKGPDGRWRVDASSVEEWLTYTQATQHGYPSGTQAPAAGDGSSSSNSSSSLVTETQPAAGLPTPAAVLDQLRQAVVDALAPLVGEMGESRRQAHQELSARVDALTQQVEEADKRAEASAAVAQQAAAAADSLRQQVAELQEKVGERRRGWLARLFRREG